MGKPGDTKHIDPRISFLYLDFIIHLFLDVNPPWINPNAVPTGPKKKFRTSIKTRPIQSRTSQGAPYAPRVKLSNSNYDQPKVVNGKVFTKPEYNSLDDPHLNDYFARKLGQIPKLTDKKKKTKSKRRDKSVHIAYSVTVITGDKRNAGTTANVSLFIIILLCRKFEAN